MLTVSSMASSRRQTAKMDTLASQTNVFNASRDSSQFNKEESLPPKKQQLTGPIQPGIKKANAEPLENQTDKRKPLHFEKGQTTFGKLLWLAVIVVVKSLVVLSSVVVSVLLG